MAAIEFIYDQNIQNGDLIGQVTPTGLDYEYNYVGTTTEAVNGIEVNVSGEIRALDVSFLPMSIDGDTVDITVTILEISTCDQQSQDYAITFVFDNSPPIDICGTPGTPSMFVTISWDETNPDTPDFFQDPFMWIRGEEGFVDKSTNVFSVTNSGLTQTLPSGGLNNFAVFNNATGAGSMTCNPAAAAFDMTKNTYIFTVERRTGGSGVALTANMSAGVAGADGRIHGGYDGNDGYCVGGQDGNQSSNIDTATAINGWRIKYMRWIPQNSPPNDQILIGRESGTNQLSAGCINGTQFDLAEFLAGVEGDLAEVIIFQTVPPTLLESGRLDQIIGYLQNRYQIADGPITDDQFCLACPNAFRNGETKEVYPQTWQDDVDNQIWERSGGGDGWLLRMEANAAYTTTYYPTPYITPSKESLRMDIGSKSRVESIAIYGAGHLRLDAYGTEGTYTPTDYSDSNNLYYKNLVVGDLTPGLPISSPLKSGNLTSLGLGNVGPGISVKWEEGNGWP